MFSADVRYWRVSLVRDFSMRFAALVGALALGACSPGGEPQQSVESAEATNRAADDIMAAVLADDAAKAEPVVAPVAMTAEDMGRVCRAAIATVMGRDPSIIRVTATNGNIVDVRYTRDDGTVWSNRCRVESGRVTWAAIENGQPGRWRTEDNITFSADGDQITVTESIMGTETYTVR